MDNKIFKDLADGWKAATDHVLSDEAIDRNVLGDLFQNTYLLIKRYSTETMIPRDLYRVLWEMNDFHWWVIESEETPIHFLYQEITGLVVELNCFIVRGWTNELDIRYLIAKIADEV